MMLSGEAGCLLSTCLEPFNPEAAGGRQVVLFDAATHACIPLLMALVERIAKDKDKPKRGGRGVKVGGLLRGGGRSSLRTTSERNCAVSPPSKTDCGIAIVSQVAYVGLRDIDSQERKLLRDSGIQNIFTMHEARRPYDHVCTSHTPTRAHTHRTHVHTGWRWAGQSDW